MKRRTVLSMEQALSLPSATLRFAQLGWRVIRIEATPTPSGLPGDPNRYIGARVADDDRRSYFIAPNVGKEAIALNLKDSRGQEVLRRLIRELDVDVFCCNTVPARYASLGIDYATLSAAKADLIWAGISAMGPDYPEAPGYDPVIQAMSGYMEVTGDSDGPPMLAGIPVIDLKAGDEVYANVMLALLERHETGRGKAIHVSMLQAAASWLITLLPLIDFECKPDEITRAGNEHRKFIPINVYPARDGYLAIAMMPIGKLADLLGLKDELAAYRDQPSSWFGERDAIKKIIAERIATKTIAEWLAVLEPADIWCAKVLSWPELMESEGFRVLDMLQTVTREDAVSILTTRSPLRLDGKRTKVERAAPRIGEHSDKIRKEFGL